MVCQKPLPLTMGLSCYLVLLSVSFVGFSFALFLRGPSGNDTVAYAIFLNSVPNTWYLKRQHPLISYYKRASVFCISWWIAALFLGIKWKKCDNLSKGTLVPQKVTGPSAGSTTFRKPRDTRPNIRGSEGTVSQGRGNTTIKELRNYLPNEIGRNF